MAFIDNDRLQELFLVLGDKLAPVNKKWWYALGIVLVALIPFYYLLRFAFVQIAVSSYHAPQVIYTSAVKQPLQIIDKQVLSLGNNAYSGYIKIKNINLEWGVVDQQYSAVFKTLGGTVLTSVNGSVFILPASEKMIVFTRFSSQTKPDEIDVTLADTHFIRKPDVSANLALERINLQNASDGLLVSAGVTNSTPFTISQINLPVAIYNSKNEIVAVNFTYINNIFSGETRTFQYKWTVPVAGAVRAEITPEVNIFDRNLFSNAPGTSPFNQTQ